MYKSISKEVKYRNRMIETKSVNDRWQHSVDPHPLG